MLISFSVLAETPSVVPKDASTPSAAWWKFWAGEENTAQYVKVAEPFVNLRSGPGAGYPVFHVSERAELLKILLRKTDWIKVEDANKRQGWVSIDDFEKLENLSGTPLVLDEPRFDDYTTHPWEFGLLSGSFDESAVNSGYIGYWMTDNLSAELWGAQVIGNASESNLMTLALVHQIFPAWRFSPFFTLGAGKIWIEPKASLSQENKRSEDLAFAGIGLRYYLSHRYFLRFEFKEYKLFTQRETNEEAHEWKIGLSVFF